MKARREREADLSKNYVDQMRALLVHYILPYFHSRKRSAFIISNMGCIDCLFVPLADLDGSEYL